MLGFRLMAPHRQRVNGDRVSSARETCSALYGWASKQPWIMGLGLLVITLVAYIPVLRGGFIWDDSLITGNPMVKASDGFHRFWLTTEPLDYYPLTWSLWWLEWRAWGNNATGWHVVNVFLHAANATLLWIILRRLKIPGAWLAGLVFAIHPVNVATAAWISEQKNTLCMLFYAATVLLYLKFDEEGQWRWYGLSLAAFLLALLSKTAVVMLPVVLLGCIWWRRGSLRGKDLMRSLPFFALSLVLGLVTVWFQYYRAMGGTTTRTDGFLSRLVAAGWVPWFYLYKALWPFHLTAIYPKWNVNTSLWASYVPGVVMLGCLSLFWQNRKTWGRPLLFALGYFVVTLFPVLGFFDQGFYACSLVADPWQYVAIIGAIAMVVATGAAAWRRMGKWGRYVGLLMAAAVLVVLGAATWGQSSVYANSQTLWQDTIAKNPDAWMAHNNLGNDLLKAGEIHQAIEHFERALRIKPDYTDAHNDLGNALLKTGKLPDAIEQYKLALRFEPTLAEGYYNLGNALDQAGRIQDAISQYQLALQINQHYAEAHNNLGVALAKVGKVKDAMGHFEQALQIEPDYAEAHFNMGNALAQVGRLQDAAEHYEQAVRIQPDNADAHNNLGSTLLQLGRSQEAIGHFEQTLRLKPDDADVHYDLGLALLQAGKLEDAIGQFERALRIAPDDALAHYNMGNALFGLGNVREAAAQYEQALRLKPDFAEAKASLARARAAQ
jgi:tetratricopeptide (TPR) repeat protein